MPTPSDTNATMSSGECARVALTATSEVSEDREPSATGTTIRGRDALGDRHDADAGDDHRERAGHEREPGRHGRSPTMSCRCCDDEVEEADERDDAEQVDEHRAAERAAGGRAACRAWASRGGSWRRTNSTPKTMPATTIASGSEPSTPCAANSLIAVDDRHHRRRARARCSAGRSGPGAGRGSRARGAARARAAARAPAPRGGTPSPRRSARAGFRRRRAERGAGREAGGPDRDGQAALIAVGEDARAAARASTA